MKKILLTDALAGCVDHCGWCVHQCPEEDKYEILVACIRLQSEFNKLCLSVYSLLPNRSTKTIKNISNIFNAFAINYQRKERIRLRYWNKQESDADDFRKLPGCSQIFHISQILKETYLNKQYGNE